jgi:hypothetical protein
MTDGVKADRKNCTILLNKAWNILQSFINNCTNSELVKDLEREVLEDFRWGHKDAVSLAMIRLQVIINRVKENFYDQHWHPSKINYCDEIHKGYTV